MRMKQPVNDKSTVLERFEAFTSYGAPTCDVCRNEPREDRHEQAEFCPDDAVYYLRGDESEAYEFFAATLCEHHDRPEHHPSDATHRVLDNPEYIGDEHRMNSAYAHDAVGMEVL